MIVYNILKGEFNLSEDKLLSGSSWMILYYVTTIVLGAILGISLRKLFIETAAFRLHPIFEVDDRWVRLFTAPYIRKNFALSIENLVIGIDALMEGDDSKFTIYSGTLLEFNVDDRGNLQDLTLEDVYRRKLVDDLEPYQSNISEQTIDDRYYHLPGHLFIVQMNRVVNLHITYNEVEIVEMPTNN